MKFLGLFECSLLGFCSQGERILGVFEVLVGIFEKTKEKTDREEDQNRHFSAETATYQMVR